MREFFFFEQRAGLFQLFNDPSVSLKDELALQITGLCREFSFRIHRRKDFEAVPDANFVVFLTMAGSDVNAAGALLLSHEFAQDHAESRSSHGWRQIIPSKLCAFPCRVQDLIICRAETNGFHNPPDQVLIHDQGPFGRLNRQVGEIGMDGDRLVGSKVQGVVVQMANETFSISDFGFRISNLPFASFTGNFT